MTRQHAVGIKKTKMDIDMAQNRTEVAGLEKKITDALKAIRGTDLLMSTKEEFNFFDATGCSGYELRHAAFFSWLFDTRKHNEAANFVLRFMRGVAEEIGDQRLVEEFKGYHINAVSSDITVKPIPLSSSGSLNEVAIPSGKRIDFAADIHVKNRHAVRLVIEFKLRGTVGNDLDAYYEAASSGVAKKRMCCLLIDFAGQVRPKEGSPFTVFDPAVLVRAVEGHLKVLEDLPESSCDKYYAVQSYHRLLRRHIEHQFSSNVEERKKLWNLWTPEMQRSSSAKSLDKFFYKTAHDLVHEEQADRAYGQVWWQVLALQTIHGWLKSEAGYDVKDMSGTWLKMTPGYCKNNKHFYFWLFLSYGGWLPLHKDHKDQFYIRVSLRSYQGSRNKGEIERYKDQRKVLQGCVEQIAEKFMHKDARKATLSGGDKPLSTASYVWSDGGFQKSRINRRDKDNEFDVTFHFLFPISEDKLYQIAVNGKAGGARSQFGAWHDALVFIRYVSSVLDSYE